MRKIKLVALTFCLWGCAKQQSDADRILEELCCGKPNQNMVYQVGYLGEEGSVIKYCKVGDPDKHQFVWGDETKKYWFPPSDGWLIGSDSSDRWEYITGGGTCENGKKFTTLSYSTATIIQSANDFEPAS